MHRAVKCVETQFAVMKRAVETYVQCLEYPAGRLRVAYVKLFEVIMCGKSVTGFI